MVIIRPRGKISKATLLLVLAMLAALVASVAIGLFNGALHQVSILDSMLGVAVVALIVAVMYLEGKRAHSIELTEETIIALVWKQALGFLPYKVMPLTVLWKDVRLVARKGFMVGLKGDFDGEILINTYLFEDPAKVLAFINEHLAKAAAENPRRGAAD